MISQLSAVATHHTSIIRTPEHHHHSTADSQGQIPGDSGRRADPCWIQTIQAIGEAYSSRTGTGDPGAQLTTGAAETVHARGIAVYEIAGRCAAEKTGEGRGLVQLLLLPPVELSSWDVQHAFWPLTLWMVSASDFL
jgi:hypothetical protein